MSFVPRPYQLEARYQINAMLNAGRNPCLVISTGCGKTKISCMVISDRISAGKRIYVLVPSIEAFQQWVIELNSFGLNPGTINDEGMKGRDRKVYVCMPISLSNIIQLIPEKLYPDELYFDEAHHTACDTWGKILDRFNGAQYVGITATPRRIDRKPLTMFSDIISTITMKEAIDQGYLARPLCIVPKDYHARLEVPDSDIDTPAGLERQAAALGETQIIGDVIGNYSHIFAGLPVFVACSTFGHAEMMTKAFTDAGWKWAHIHSELPSRERARMLRDIKTGKLHGLCTVGIGIEAMDIPGLYGLIWLRRTCSLTIYLQFIGRVLRPLKGKKYGIILDPVGNLFIHGFPDMPHVWSLEGEEPITPSSEHPTMISCPWCGTYNATSNLVCHFCNQPLVGEEADEAREQNSRHLPAMVDGELIAVTSDGQAQEIGKRSDEIKEESKESSKPRDIPVLTKKDRAGILRGELFARNRPLFEEAVRGMK